MSATRYSEWIDGDAGNYGWRVRYDADDHYLGISQAKDHATEYVFLSPGQVRALVAFMRAPSRVRTEQVEGAAIKRMRRPEAKKPPARRAVTRGRR